MVRYNGIGSPTDASKDKFDRRCWFHDVLPFVEEQSLSDAFEAFMNKPLSWGPYPSALDFDKALNRRPFVCLSVRSALAEDQDVSIRAISTADARILRQLRRLCRQLLSKQAADGRSGLRAIQRQCAIVGHQSRRSLDRRRQRQVGQMHGRHYRIRRSFRRSVSWKTFGRTTRVAATTTRPTAACCSRRSSRPTRLAAMKSPGSAARTTCRSRRSPNRVKGMHTF